MSKVSYVPSVYSFNEGDCFKSPSIKEIMSAPVLSQIELDGLNHEVVGGVGVGGLTLTSDGDLFLSDDGIHPRRTESKNFTPWVESGVTNALWIRDLTTDHKRRWNYRLMIFSKDHGVTWWTSWVPQTGNKRSANELIGGKPRRVTWVRYPSLT